MTERIREICESLSYAEVFADIGCDHGYCTEYMLKHDLCARAYISDISAGSLSKAEKLLKKEIEKGRCIPVVANGLEGIKEPCNLVLIAGMGGEEIIKILTDRPLPERFVLQPMQNSEKLRRFLIERGARIERDDTFGSGPTYDRIVGYGEGGDGYSEFEYRYGRDNLRSPSKAFLLKLEHDMKNYRTALAAPTLNGARRDGVRQKLYELEMIRDAIEGDL